MTDLERRRDQERALWVQEQYPSVDARFAEMERRWPSYWETLGVDPRALALPVPRVCVIGCNRGGHERQVAATWAAVEIDAIDLIEPTTRPEGWVRAEASIGDRLRYWPGTDVQQALPRPPYGLVVATAVIHHCPFPEAAAAVIYEALAPGGYLLLEEYVGAPGLSASDQRQRVAQRLWDALPPEYRGAQQQLHRPERAHANGLEAFASDQIEPAFRGLFEVVAERNANPLGAYRMIRWGDSGRPRGNPDVDRLVDAFEAVLMGEGWLGGEDWTALLRRSA